MLCCCCFLALSTTDHTCSSKKRRFHCNQIPNCPDNSHSYILETTSTLQDQSLTVAQTRWLYYNRVKLGWDSWIWNVGRQEREPVESCDERFITKCVFDVELELNVKNAFILKHSKMLPPRLPVRCQPFLIVRYSPRLQVQRLCLVTTFWSGITSNWAEFSVQRWTELLTFPGHVFHPDDYNSIGNRLLAYLILPITIKIISEEKKNNMFQLVLELYSILSEAFS